MSRTRYYPVSQSFLNDAETWEMRDQFGDRSVFFWMSLLSVAEMDDGNVHGTPSYIARIHGQYLDRTHPQRAQNVLVFLVNKGWLTPLLKDGLTVGYFITNYWKYHRRQLQVTDANINIVSRSPILSEPSEPNLKSPIVPLIDIPDWIPLQPWEAYLKHRKHKRAKVTPEAAHGLIEKLLEFKKEGEDITAILKQSVTNGWTGLFPVGKGNGRPAPELAHSTVPAYKPLPLQPKPDKAEQARVRALLRGVTDKLGVS